MAEWEVVPLARSHERHEFTCGKEPLDRFLHALVNQYEKRRIGRTFVAVRAGEKRVLGYYTLASGAIPFASFPPEASRKLPRHPVPAILLARLAVDQSAQGQGLGGILLGDALLRCLALAEQLGVYAIEVEAIDQQARTFYERHGFALLLDDQLHLYLPMATIERAPRDG
ncbi:MAG: GNAT family N-acetyltransferase [Gemmataceae bacterium]